ncbi:MAG: hypothetical protein ACRDSZ_20070 [Pseudonocardiaceae bacterium]
MTLIKIAGDCKDGDCPAVYRTERGTIGVKGTPLEGVDCPGNEAIVEIPIDLLRRAARVIS